MRQFSKLIEISQAMKPIDFNDRCYHTTIAMNKSKIIAIGINNYKKTHPKNLYLDHICNDTGNHYGEMAGIHSELSCLLKLRREDCSKLTFVNIRIDRNEEVNLSKPCRACTGMMKQVGYKKFYYSTKEGFQQL